MSVEKLRSLSLGAPAKGRTKTVTIALGEQSGEVEVRAPTLKQQQRTAEQATGKDGKVDAHKSVALMIIACTWDPEENVQVFSMKDLDTIMGFGTNGWVGQLMSAIASLATAPKELEESFE